MKVKVFESGNYPQGEFNAEKVKNIFSKVVEPIKAIFSHTSKYKQGEAPIEIGSFKDFIIEEKGEKAIVYGNVDFNEKGNNYYKDNILKGVSVEIDKDTDTLTKVAILPIGITPAVQGAEFQEMIVEFEVVKEDSKDKPTPEEPKEITIDEVIAKFGNEYNITKKEEVVVKTEEEIREEVKKEFEAKYNAKKLKDNFLEKNKSKLTPTIKEFMTDKLLETIFEDSRTLEFGENENYKVHEVIEKLFDKLPNINTEEFSKKVEIKENDEEIDFMKKAKEETLKRYGN